MHSVVNLEPPHFLLRNGQSTNAFESKYRSGNNFVWDFGGSDEPSISDPPVDRATRIADYVKLILALAEQFNGPHPDAKNENKLLGVCAYCERLCDDRNGQNQNTVDHFRPRKTHNQLMFEWRNLMYVCRRCNKAKDDDWFNVEVDQGGFVDPREPAAEIYLGFDLKTGGAIVHPDLQDSKKRCKAQRTIDALALDREDINRLRRDHLSTVRSLHCDKGRKLAPFKRRKVQFSSLIRYAEGARYFEG